MTSIWQNQNIRYVIFIVWYILFLTLHNRKYNSFSRKKKKKKKKKRKYNKNYVFKIVATIKMRRRLIFCNIVHIWHVIQSLTILSAPTLVNRVVPQNLFWHFLDHNLCNFFYFELWGMRIEEIYMLLRIYFLNYWSHIVLVEGTSFVGRERHHFQHERC